ncbi:MAG: disulfide bond formation protein DsbA [Acidimicrobiia bacterium]|nr:disulfide bond formation protein DsbA [Acidimicrobiia bacterium]
MTARWVVEQVAPHRGLDITWQPISLLLKNEPAEDSSSYGSYLFTHKLLRVMEAVRAAHGDEAVFPFYWELGTRIHHDKDRAFEPGVALTAAGFDLELEAAFDDPGWDDEIEKRMAVGLDLAGTDIGTPIIALDDPDGDRVAIFGPVITRVPPSIKSLAIWDAVVTLATTEDFWELKRTRTERPDFGERPELVPFSAT